jgi:hypothetical protein
MRQIIVITTEPGLVLDEVTKLIATLNALGRESAPAFGVGVSATTKEGAPAGAPFEGISLTIACAPSKAMPAAVERIGRAALDMLVQRGGTGHIRLGGVVVTTAPGCGPVEIADLAGRLVGEAAASPALLSLTPFDWPDPSRDAGAFRQFVEALSGLIVEGCVEVETVNGTDMYSARCTGGDVYAGPEQGGWSLAFFPTGRENPTRVWQTTPTPSALVTSLLLDVYLDSEQLADSIEFRRIELVPEAHVERKQYETAIGPVIVHTRRKTADTPVETVVEVLNEGRIFILDAEDRFVGASGEMGRRELRELPF